jgi:hypothetical protein
MDESRARDRLPDGSTERPFKSIRKGSAIISLALLGIGILLVSIGLPNEMRIRPHVTYSNCVYGHNEDGMLQVDCDVDPPEYHTYLYMVVVGSVLIFTAGILYTTFYLVTRARASPGMKDATTSKPTE